MKRAALLFIKVSLQKYRKHVGRDFCVGFSQNLQSVTAICCTALSLCAAEKHSRSAAKWHYDTRCRISVLQEDKLVYGNKFRSEGSVILLSRTSSTAVKTKKTVFTQNIKASSPWELLYLSRRSSASRVGLVLPFSGLAWHAASCSERRRLISAKISLQNNKQGSHNACMSGSNHDKKKMLWRLPQTCWI